MHVTLNGFVGGTQGDLDWMVWDWDDVLKKYATELTNSADTFMMGRATGQGMAVYWPTVASNPESKADDLWMANILNSAPKIVFSKTVSAIDWINVRVARDIVEEIKHLKQQPGKDLLLYGGADVVASFIKENLIDEYHLFVNPVAIGTGKAIFNELDSNLKLKLIKTITSSVGIVVLCYEPEKATSKNII